MTQRYMRGDPLESLFPPGSTAASMLCLYIDPVAGFQISDGHTSKKVMPALVLLERALLADGLEVAGLLPWSGARRLGLLIQPRGEYQVTGIDEAAVALLAANAKPLL